MDLIVTEDIKVVLMDVKDTLQNLVEFALKNIILKDLICVIGTASGSNNNDQVKSSYNEIYFLSGFILALDLII